MIVPGATPAAPSAELPAPVCEQPAPSGEAPAEFASIDHVAESSTAETLEAAPVEPGHEPVAPPADLPIPDYEQPALSGEAPAEFALIGEIAEAPAETADEEPPDPDLQSVLQLDIPHVEAPYAETAVQAAAPELEVHQDEPSPYVEAVADEPASPATAEPAPAVEAAASAPAAAEPAKLPSWLDEPLPNTRRHPLRFMWQMDTDGRFALGSDDFTRLIGARTAAGFGRLWSEIADAFGLDPERRVVRAVATRNTWSGITLNWPVDDGSRLPVELSGLPIYDRNRNFAGFRGFGVCRDLDGLARLAALRRYEFFSDPPAPRQLSAGIVGADPVRDPPAADPPAA